MKTSTVVSAILAGKCGRVKRIGEAEQDAEPKYLSECSSRDKPWDGHRSDADDVARIYHDAQQNRADADDVARIYRDGGSKWMRRLGERVSECSPLLGFVRAPDRTHKLSKAFFCRVRLCPVCQWRRTLKWMARFHKAMPQVMKQHPTARFLFLVLTRKNVSIGELRRTLREMNSAFQRLSQKKRFRSAVLGWIRTVEITRGEDGTAHPHFNVLVMVPANYFKKRYIDKPEWCDMWRHALRVGRDVVDDGAQWVETVKPSKRDEAKHGVPADILSAARETLKYSVKPSDMKGPPRWLHELTRQIHRSKFITSGGLLKGVLGEEKKEKEKDLLLLGESEITDKGPLVFFGWHRQEKRYKKENQNG